MPQTQPARLSGSAGTSSPDASPPAGWREATLSCRVRPAEPDDNAVVLVGVFPERIPEGRPGSGRSADLSLLGPPALLPTVA